MEGGPGSKGRLMRSFGSWVRGAAAMASAGLVTGGLALVPAAASAAAASNVGYVDALGYAPQTTKGALWNIAETVGAHAMYKAGYTGKGVGVALIDTGVTEVPGLDTGNVIHGPDLSFDSQDPQLAHKDAYGHGTHLASIIAGRDAAGTPASYADPTRFNGIAPDANLVDVKVGASDGAVDVSQVIAGIDWVIQHRNDNGMNIRVINLSYGTDSTQDTDVDPLVYAVERAWRAGIVVVVAGGNDGSSTYTLADPARSPYVLAVGADDTQGTVGYADDVVPSWASRGTNQRHVDVVAPGVSVLGERVPNGYADERHADARVGTRFAKASGTSQAAAVVSGEVALLLQALPKLTPDQVKGLMMTSAHPFSSTDVKYRGNGLTDVSNAFAKRTSNFTQAPDFFSAGTGSLEASRGSSHVNDGVADLRGEVDIFGRAWNGAAWAKSSAPWVGGSWMGSPWTGSTWNGRTWADIVWSANTWSGRTWRDDQWQGRTWANGTWTGGDWTGRTWRDANWSGRTWRTADFASAGWLSRTWG